MGVHLPQPRPAEPTDRRRSGSSEAHESSVFVPRVSGTTIRSSCRLALVGHLCVDAIRAPQRRLATAYRNTCPQFWWTRCVVSIAPRASTRLSSASKSAGRMDAMVRAPIQGNTSRSSLRMIFSACEGAQVGSFLAYHSRATASDESIGGKPAKARSWASRCLAVALRTCLRASLGSTPSATKVRASSAFFLAVLRLTFG